MAETQLGTRGVYRAGVELKLPYQVYDADNHIWPPKDAEVRHLEKRYMERVFPSGKSHWTEVDVIGDEHKAKTLGQHPVRRHGGVDPLEMPEMAGPIPIPGAMLDRFNPMKDLDKEGRERVVQNFRKMEPAFENRDHRLKLMDDQGVQATIIHAGRHLYERPCKRGDVSAGYAAARAWNRYLQNDWGFAHKERIFTPAYFPFVDVERDVEELERCMKEGARLVGFETRRSLTGRSPADPYFDPFWSRVNEAGLRVVLHLGGNLAHRGPEWGEDPNTGYKDFNGFQWLAFWSDFPIMETVFAFVFHGFLTRFPNINVLIAEHGTPWLPYALRKMDHAHLLGFKPKWGGQLPMRPSELFKTRFVIAPFPEEAVARAIDVVGPECVVFGSDFPHSEGLPDPVQYSAQLQGLPEPTVKAIMRDNLARFLKAA